MSDLKRIRKLRDYLKDKQAIRSQAMAVVEAFREEAKAAALRMEIVGEGSVLLENIAGELQRETQELFATVATEAMSAVFDDPYAIDIEFGSSRGSSTATILFQRDGHKIDPIGAAGGGAVDVAAMALRVSALKLHQPAVRSILVLDEPFRFVSSRYQKRVAQLIRQLADEHGIQILMVTHNTKYSDMGKVVDISGDD